MRNNNLFLYILYALLAGLVILAGFKAWEMNKRDKFNEKEDQALKEAIRNTRADEADSLLAGSSFEGENSVVTSDGIEYEREDPKPQTVKPSATKPPAKPQETKPKEMKPQEIKPPAPAVQKPAPEKVTSAPPPVPTGKYKVITGAFKSKANAREEMEGLIKMGYINAEVTGSVRPGWYHVIAFRSNSRSSADNTAAKLKAQGFAGAYVKQ